MAAAIFDIGKQLGQASCGFGRVEQRRTRGSLGRSERDLSCRFWRAYFPPLGGCGKPSVEDRRDQEQLRKNVMDRTGERGAASVPWTYPR